MKASQNFIFYRSKRHGIKACNRTIIGMSSNKMFMFSAVFAVNPPNPNRASHPYEFIRPGTRRGNEVGSKSPHQVNRLKPPAPGTGDKVSFKKTNGVPPYAVLMEPLVKYSQPDPLYNAGKEQVSESKVSGLTKTDLKVEKKETKDEVQPKISSKSGQFAYEDSEPSATFHHKKQKRPHHHVEYSAPGIYYEGPIPEEPEPIIEIIIKESNQSLPTPPPPPPPPKKKKEHVQVFYVKYKKDPHALYGEDKIVYDAPVPAVTPPTNNADHHEEEEEEYLQHQQQLHHYEEDHTLPPRPSTTLKAIIRPDSETYHGSGGVQITFGSPLPEEGGYGHDPHHHDHHHHHHRGDLEEQSAPQPSVLLPPKSKVTPVSKSAAGSQLTKRNPAPFHSQTQPPQQSFHSPSAAPPRDIHRPTPPPSFQQVPQFPAQQFKPQPPRIQSNHPPPPPTPSRPSPSLRYSTLPQHLQPLPKSQPSISFPQPRHPPPPPPPPQQPIPQQTVHSNQFYTINQPHLKSSFSIGVRPTPSQQYHTISPQASQQLNFAKPQPFPQSVSSPVFNQPPKQFPPPNHSFPPQPVNTFSQQSSIFPQSHGLPPPSPTFSQVPSQALGPIIQTHPAPVLSSQNNFVNRPVLPPQTIPAQSQPPINHQEFLQQHQLQFQQQQQQHFQQQQQQKHQQQVEQLNRLQQQQQRLQSQILDQQKQTFINQQKYQTTYAPEIIRSVSPDLSFTSHRFEVKKPTVPTTSRPHFQPTSKSNVRFTLSKNLITTTESYKKHTQTTQPPVEYVTEDPKKAEEERRKKEERKKQNVAALPKEVPDDLREQLLSSGILGNADIQILDYDKIGDIPIESLPPEALANFQAVAGSEPVPAIARPNSPRNSQPKDAVAEASEQSSVYVAPNTPKELMEMKVVRFNPESKEGAQVANQYVKEGATQLEPVVLNDSRYNRYLPLKVAGAQFPVPDVPELRGKNVTSVVVLAPVDYEFLQRHDDVVDEEGRAGRRSSHPVLEVQGVHFVAGDVLKTLVKRPTAENYRKWLEKENKTPLDKQSVVLLVIEPKDNSTAQEKEIFMYDIGSRKVSKLSGELSAQFVEVAESNSENDDLEEISDSPGGDFTIKDTSEISPVHVRSQRKATVATVQKAKSSLR